MRTYGLLFLVLWLLSGCGVGMRLSPAVHGSVQITPTVTPLSESSVSLSWVPPSGFLVRILVYPRTWTFGLPSWLNTTSKYVYVNYEMFVPDWLQAYQNRLYLAIASRVWVFPDFF